MSSQDLEPRVKSLEDTFRTFVDQQNKRDATLFSKIDHMTEAMGREIDMVKDSTKPNFGNMALWAGILLTVIGMIATPIGFFALRELDRQEKNTESLDTKLQHEYTLINANTESLIQNVDKVSVQRYNDAISSVNRVVSKLDVLQAFVDHQTEHDLDELRQRRFNDKKQ